MPTRLVVRAVSALTLVGALVTAAHAQSSRGAFDRLAPSDQRTARYLFEAQRRNLPPGGRLTLDQIAARKGNDGWGGVFREMKSERLVNARDLGELVNRRAAGSVVGRLE